MSETVLNHEQVPRIDDAEMQIAAPSDVTDWGHLSSGEAVPLTPVETLHENLESILTDEELERTGLEYHLEKIVTVIESVEPSALDTPTAQALGDLTSKFAFTPKYPRFYPKMDVTSGQKGPGIVVEPNLARKLKQGLSPLLESDALSLANKAEQTSNESGVVNQEISTTDEADLDAEDKLAEAYVSRRPMTNKTYKSWGKTAVLKDKAILDSQRLELKVSQKAGLVPKTMTVVEYAKRITELETNRRSLSQEPETTVDSSKGQAEHAERVVIDSVNSQTEPETVPKKSLAPDATPEVLLGNLLGKQLTDVQRDSWQSTAIRGRDSVTQSQRELHKAAIKAGVITKYTSYMQFAEMVLSNDVATRTPDTRPNEESSHEELDTAKAKAPDVPDEVAIPEFEKSLELVKAKESSRVIVSEVNLKAAAPEKQLSLDLETAEFIARFIEDYARDNSLDEHDKAAFMKSVFHDLDTHNFAVEKYYPEPHVEPETIIEIEVGDELLNTQDTGPVSDKVINTKVWRAATVGGKHMAPMTELDGESRSTETGGKHMLGVPTHEVIGTETPDTDKTAREQMLFNLGTLQREFMAEPVTDPSAKGMRARLKRVMSRAKAAMVIPDDDQWAAGAQKLKQVSRKHSEQVFQQVTDYRRKAGETALKSYIDTSVALKKYFNDPEKGRTRKTIAVGVLGVVGVAAAGVSLHYGMSAQPSAEKAEIANKFPSRQGAAAVPVLDMLPRSNRPDSIPGKHFAKAAHEVHEIVKGDTYSDIEHGLHPKMPAGALYDLVHKVEKLNGDNDKTARALRIGRKILTR